MLGTHIHTRAHRRADHERAGGFAAEHVAKLRGLVVDLVHANADEVGEHDLRDRPQTGQCRACPGADDGRLRDRRIDDAVFAKLEDEPLADTEYATGGIALAGRTTGPAGYVFAEDDDALVAPHFFE